MQYHDKELYQHLKHYKLHFEMFATSWMLTIFTRVVEFLLVYELWEIFLFERDKYFIFYFAAALLKVNRDKILSLAQFEKIIKLLTMELQIKDFTQLCNVYYEAVAIRASTPLSFQILIS